MAWNVEFTNESAEWYARLNRQDQLKIGAAIDSLENGARHSGDRTSTASKARATTT